MNLISKIFAGTKDGGLVSSTGTIVDSLTTTKGEKMQLDLELRKAEWGYINEARRLENEERGLILQDKDSARKMHRQVQMSDKASRLNKNVSAYLALITTALSFALFFVILFFPEQLQEGGQDIIIYILGVLSAIVTQVFSFYFGSSLGKEEGSPGTP
ncbi:hypothetical protein [Geofilum rubicundum]|nr:hypothetical protein [Geofilum rubicundum]